jgi:hypothetical protein
MFEYCIIVINTRRNNTIVVTIQNPTGVVYNICRLYTTQKEFSKCGKGKKTQATVTECFNIKSCINC